jgi:hypothetical protein
MGTLVRRTFMAACITVGSVAASASPASAAVTIGQTGPVTGTCGVNSDWAQKVVTSGNSYVVPSLPPATSLSITSWSHQAYTGPGQKLKFKVYRPVSGLTYTVVGVDLRDLAPDVLNTFKSNIPVAPGDILGITNASTPAVSTGCGIGPFTETDLQKNGADTALGAQVTFINQAGARLDISAVVEPTNTFTFGATTRNKKKGTATLTIEVPNPGELTVSGHGVKALASAATSITAGAVQLKIKATGKKRKKLNRNGKVKLSPTITYTPTGGSASTQPMKVTLKKL